MYYNQSFNMQKRYIDGPFTYSCFVIVTGFFHFLATRSSIQMHKTIF